MNIASEGKGTKYSNTNADLVTTSSLKLVEIEYTRSAELNKVTNMHLGQRIPTGFSIVVGHMTTRAIHSPFIMKFGLNDFFLGLPGVRFVCGDFREKKTSPVIDRTKPLSSTLGMLWVSMPEKEPSYINSCIGYLYQSSTKSVTFWPMEIMTVTVCSRGIPNIFQPLQVHVQFIMSTFNKALPIHTPNTSFMNGVTGYTSLFATFCSTLSSIFGLYTLSNSSTLLYASQA